VLARMKKKSSISSVNAVVPGRVQCLMAVLVLLVCILGGWTSARAGLSRLFSNSSVETESIAAAERALAYDVADPEAHYQFALALFEGGRSEEALAEFERATQLRPADYFFWQELGRVRDETGDSTGAIAALRVAVKLAPSYSQPHWQLGNLLLRELQLYEAFQEMQRAVATEPTQFPVMIDLAWGVLGENQTADVAAVLALVQPQNDNQLVLLATLFVRHGQFDAARNLMLTTGKNVAKEDRRALVAGLIEAEDFSGAYQIWLQGEGRDGGLERGEVFDGGFEGTIESGRDSRSFGWQPTQLTATVHFLIDPNQPHSGTRSLRIEYDGNFASLVPVISQLLLVAPNTRYRLSFYGRSEALLSGALPVVVMREATGAAPLISQSLPLPSGTTDWRQFVINFDTTSATNAVTISIQRQSCSSSPCPIVGRAWFDSFSLSTR
jgi:Flp pilus assembly protein TadD